MAYDICRRCQKMFKKDGKRYCPDCNNKHERDFKLVEEYIKRHPKATILDIITNTVVSLKSINCMIDDGDVSYVENRELAEGFKRSLGNQDNPSMKKGKFYLHR